MTAVAGKPVSDTLQRRVNADYYKGKDEDMRVQSSVSVGVEAAVCKWAKSFRAFVRTGLLFAAATLAQHAIADARGVYVAGNGSSLEQAFRQAIADTRGETKANFWIVATGAEAARLTRKSAGRDLLQSLKTVRERGGSVYACRSDLLRAGIKEDDLADGVAPVYGYGAHEWAGLLPVRKVDIVLPENAEHSQLILKTCSKDDQGSLRK